MRGNRGPRGVSHRNKATIAGENYTGDAAAAIAAWGGGDPGVAAPAIGSAPTLTIVRDDNDDGKDVVASKKSSGNRRVADDGTKSRLRTQFKALANWIALLSAYFIYVLSGLRSFKSITVDAVGNVTLGATTTGGDFKAGANGVAIIERDGGGDAAIRRTYVGANVRGIVSHNGFRMGRCVERNENWLTNFLPANGVTTPAPIPSTNMYWWAGGTGSGDIIEILGPLPTPGMANGLILAAPDTFVQVQTRTAVDGSAGGLVYDLAVGMIYELEFEVYTTGMGSAGGQLLFMGFLNNPGSRFAGIGLRATDTFWQVVTRNGGGSITYTPTLVPVGNGTLHTCKVEYHTTNSPHGLCVRVWIDGVLTTVAGGTVPTGVGSGMEVVFTQDFVTSNVGVTYVSPYRFAYNRLATVGDN